MTHVMVGDYNLHVLLLSVIRYNALVVNSVSPLIRQESSLQQRLYVRRTFDNKNESLCETFISLVMSEQIAVVTFSSDVLSLRITSQSPMCLVRDRDAWRMTSIVITKSQPDRARPIDEQHIDANLEMYNCLITINYHVKLSSCASSAVNNN